MSKANPFLHASAKGLIDEVRKYLEYCSPDERDENYQTPLHLACLHNQLNVIKLLLLKSADVNAQDGSGWTPLHCSAYSGHLSACDLLLREQKADSSLQNRDGTTALHYLTRHSTGASGAGLYKEVFQMMLKKGVDIDSQSDHGESPLHQACLRGNFEAATLLLDNGASVNLLNKNGESSLDYAYRTNNSSIINLLLSKGAISPSLDQPESNDSTNFRLLTVTVCGAQLTLPNENDVIPSLRCSVKYLEQHYFTDYQKTLSPTWNQEFQFYLSTQIYPLKVYLWGEGTEPHFRHIEFLEESPTPENTTRTLSLTLKHHEHHLSGQLFVSLSMQPDPTNGKSNSADVERDWNPLDIQAERERERVTETLSCTKSTSDRVTPTIPSISTTTSTVSFSSAPSISFLPNNIAFGQKRGNCLKKNCDCATYVSDGSLSHTLCLNCGHYPAKHKNLGAWSSFDCNQIEADDQLSPTTANRQKSSRRLSLRNILRLSGDKVERSTTAHSPRRGYHSGGSPLRSQSLS